ncbi:unnamed protein product [Cochlearia groenlandica]
MARSGRGRQKIEMVKIKKESSLQVTFSKRRFGLFKKASELCTLCGIQIVMIVFSPGGRAYSFGHPNVKDLIYRFLNYLNNPFFLNNHNYNNFQMVETCPDQNIQALNDILIKELATQKDQKNRRMEIDEIKENRERSLGHLFNKDMQELNVSETDLLIEAAQELKNKLVSENISEYYYDKMNHHGFRNNNYVGESSSSNIITHVGPPPSGILDQTRMMDLSAFKLEPNMNFSNYGQVPYFGIFYDNNGVMVPGPNMNYMPSS